MPNVYTYAWGRWAGAWLMAGWTGGWGFIIARVGRHAARELCGDVECLCVYGSVPLLLCVRRVNGIDHVLLWGGKGKGRNSARGRERRSMGRVNIGCMYYMYMRTSSQPQRGVYL